MTDASDAAYNIYARHLFGRRHGHPLWIPEPNKNMEIELGDVGYLREGGFYRIFNTIRPSDDALNCDNGVPDSYTPFKIKPMLWNQTKSVIGSHLCSTSVTSYSLSGDLATATAPVGAGIKFECSTEQGAFVFTDKPPDRTQMHPSKSFARYMRTNIEGWHDLARNKNDLDIQKEELMFISGVIKSNDWGLGAFLHHGHCGEVSFQAQLGPFLQGSFQFKMKKEGVAGNAELRVKPVYDEQETPTLPAITSPPGESSSVAGSSSVSPGASSNAASKGRMDQCLFINFYKVKKRFWGSNKVLQAAAGPDERDPDSSGDGMSPGVAADDYEVVEEPAIPTPYNAVDHLLDYILDQEMEDGTQAVWAIGSPSHLYTLFDGDLPLDIRAELDKLRPPLIFLDDAREMASLACAEWSEEFDEVDEELVDAAETVIDGTVRGTELLPEDLNTPPNEEDNDSRKDDTELKDARPVGGSVYGAIQAAVVLQEHTGGVTCVAFSPDGRYIASGSEDATILLRDSTTGRVIQALTEHQDGVWTLAFSPDGTRLASGASDGFALVWDVESRTVATVLDGHRGVVQTIAYSYDGKRVVTASVDFTVRVWDAETGVLQHVLAGHEAVVLNAVFSPDGRWIGSCGADYTARIWDAHAGTLRHTLEEHSGVVWALAFSPDSRRVVTGSDDATARVWNAETGEELVTLREHHGPVWAVAFSPDGKLVMSASNDATIKVCDSFSGECRRVFERRDTLVNSAVFSPDGRYIASSAADNSVIVWNLKTGKSMVPMKGHKDKVTGLQFSQEVDRLVSSSDDGTIRIWKISGVEMEA